MAFRDPNWMDNIPAYSAEEDRQLIGAIAGPLGGVVAPSHFKVTCNASAVCTVAPGRAFVVGTSSPMTQGAWSVTSDSAVTPATLARPGPTIQRMDLVCLRIRDSAYGAPNVGVNSSDIFVYTGANSAANASAPVTTLATAMSASGFQNMLALAQVTVPNTGTPTVQNMRYLATGGFTPVGTILPWAGPITGVDAILPAGFIACAGGTPSISTYPELAEVLGNAWGGSPGTTFGLPDMRNRSAQGAGGIHSLGVTGGSETTVIANTSLPSHVHPHAHTHGGVVNDWAHTHWGGTSRRYLTYDEANAGTENLYANTDTGLRLVSIGAPALGIQNIHRYASTEIVNGSTTTLGLNTNSQSAANTDANSSNGGAAVSLTTVSPYISMNYIIKAL